MEARHTDPPDFAVFKSVFYYCFTIICLPVVTFFCTKFLVLDGIFGLESMPSNVYSAIAAVIVIHITLGMYIYKAYSGSPPGKAPSKVD